MNIISSTPYFHMYGMSVINVANRSLIHVPSAVCNDPLLCRLHQYLSTYIIGLTVLHLLILQHQSVDLVAQASQASYKVGNHPL